MKTWNNALARFTIPTSAQILQVECQTYAFHPTTHTVSIYRWGL